MPATFSTPKKVRPKRKVPNDGRPTKQTPELVQKLCAALSMGLTDGEAASVAGISDVTLTLWRRDQDFLAKIKHAVAIRLYKRLERIESGVDGWQGTAWVVERLYPSRFSKPEIQLSINNNLLTENHLSITITAGEIREIEATAEPVRASVKKMFEGYKPQLSDGNGNKNGEPKPVASIEAEMVPEPIERKPGDEKGTAFWDLFVSGDRDRLVDRGTAEFVVRVIGTQVIGAHRVGEVSFKGNEVTVGDVLDRLERLTPGSGAGWQALQRKAGIREQN